MTRLWIVRAGRGGERELDVISDGRLMLGFYPSEDLTGLKDRDAIADHLRAVMPTAGEGRIRNFAAQLNQFANVIEIGDIVVLPRKLTNGIAIGRVTGPYAFEARETFRHTRAVNWLQTSVPRDTFNQDLRHSFGAFMTVCEIKRNNALGRVQAVLDTGKDPGSLLGQQGKVAALQHDPDKEDMDAEEADLDIEELASQQIIALIKSQFAGHALADLVSEILRSEGYTTKLSPPGPDGGVDILAAGGSLGLGEERVCIQVKSSDSPANTDVVLKLIGSVHNSQAQTGLLVSIGGVNAPAQKELNNNFFKLRLWQMPDLLRALYKAYPNLSDETRARLPLKQIWVPIVATDE